MNAVNIVKTTSLGVLINAFSSLGTEAMANCLDQARLTGVNTAGAEFGLKQLPGTPHKDYTYPLANDLKFFAERGANIIRFPFRWERLQPSLNQPLDAAELARMRTVVSQAKAQNLCVLLDLHNFAKYYGDKLGSSAELDQAFIDVWLLIAKEFPDPTETVFGLMNEPANMPLKDWAVLAKKTLKALRDAQATNLVFVSGGRWSGVHDWFAGLLASNASEFHDLRDPLNRAVLEVHQYTDTDYSGTHTAATGAGCLPPDHFNSRFERITTWAIENRQQLFLGEFGVPQSSECIASLTRMLELTQEAPWRGWAYWAAGRWWGNYHMAISGYNQPLSPQWGPLDAFFYRPATDAQSPPEAPSININTGNTSSAASSARN